MPKQPLWLPFRFDRLESFDTFMHLFFKVLLVFLLSCVYQEKCEYFWKGNVVSEIFFLIFERKNIPSTYWKTKLFPCYPLSIFLSKGDSIGKGFESSVIMINSSLQSIIPKKNSYQAKKVPVCFESLQLQLLPHPVRSWTLPSSNQAASSQWATWREAVCWWFAGSPSTPRPHSRSYRSPCSSSLFAAYHFITLRSGSRLEARLFRWGGLGGGEGGGRAPDSAAAPFPHSHPAHPAPLLHLRSGREALKRCFLQHPIQQHKSYTSRPDHSGKTERELDWLGLVPTEPFCCSSSSHIRGQWACEQRTLTPDSDRADPGRSNLD